MGAYITELKAYLQSVYDAELMGDLLLQVRHKLPNIDHVLS